MHIFRERSASDIAILSSFSSLDGQVIGEPLPPRRSRADQKVGESGPRVGHLNVFRDWFPSRKSRFLACFRLVFHAGRPSDSENVSHSPSVPARLRTPPTSFAHRAKGARGGGGGNTARDLSVVPPRFPA